MERFKELFEGKGKIDLGDIVKYTETGKLYIAYGGTKSGSNFDIMEVEPKTFNDKKGGDEEYNIPVKYLTFVSKKN